MKLSRGLIVHLQCNRFDYLEFVYVMCNLKQISLYRFKDSVKSFEDCVKKNDNDEPLIPLSAYSDLNIDNIHGKFWYKEGKSVKSSKDIPWIVFANEHLPKKISSVYKNSYPRALFLYKVKIKNNDCYFAMTFGVGGDNNIDKNQIQSDFGLKVAVNICSLHEIKAVQCSKADAVAIRSETQILTGAELHLFGFDFNNEFFNKIICKANSDYPYISNVSGGEKIQIKFDKKYPLTWENLEKVTNDLNNLFISNKYKDTDFSCIDNWRYVKDKNKINELDATLFKRLNEDNIDKFYLSYPDMLDISQYRYKFSNCEKNFDELSLTDYLVLHKNRISSIDYLKRDHIYLVDSIAEQQSRSATVYRCIVAEIKENNQDTYILFDGKWRKLSLDFRKSIESYFEDNEVEFDSDYLKNDLKNNINIKCDNQYREERYNKECVTNNSSLMLFDKSKIEIAGERKYEICDILSSRKDMIHVKKYKMGASSLSHLFLQVKFYSEAILLDPKARESASNYIKKSLEDKSSINFGKDKSNFLCIFDSTERPNPRDFTVVLCVLSQNQMIIQDLPFMTQYEIKNVDDYLRGLGFNVKYVNRQYNL